MRHFADGRKWGADDFADLRGSAASRNQGRQFGRYWLWTSGLRKSAFKTENIHCARCGYRGKSLLNPLHLGLLVVLAMVTLWLWWHGVRVGMPFRLLQLRPLTVPAWPVGAILFHLVNKDEGVSLCPQCRNRFYDVIRD